MSEIKVGSIVFSPDYGKGEVLALEAEQRARVVFKADTRFVKVATLSTTNPADELAAARAQIDALTAERDLYKAFYDLAFGLDFTSDMTDSTRYDKDDIEVWAEVVDVIDRIKALRQPAHDGTGEIGS